MRGAGCSEAQLQIRQGLCGLRAEVSFANDLAMLIDGVLAADKQRGRTRWNQIGMAKRRVAVHAIGVDVLNRQAQAATTSLNKALLVVGLVHPRSL